MNIRKYSSNHLCQVENIDSADEEVPDAENQEKNPSKMEELKPCKDANFLDLLDFIHLGILIQRLFKTMMAVKKLKAASLKFFKMMKTAPPVYPRRS